MHTSCSDAPRRALRPTAIALVGGLLLGLLALVAPAPSPAGALTSTQTGVGPSADTCFTSAPSVIPTCRGVDITSSVRVNGVDVASGASLAVGDTITVAVEVAPQTGHTAMYQEVNDTLWFANTTAALSIPITLPSQTGTLLSQPTNVQMSRTDDGDRGSGPGINCLAQDGQETPREDALRSVVLNAGAAVGNTAMRASLASGVLAATWENTAYDRCVQVLSNNGIYAGMVVRFDQKVLRRDTVARSPQWRLGTLGLDGPNGAPLTWGSLRTMTLGLPAATAPTAPDWATASTGDGTLTLSWLPPVSDGGSAITGYDVVLSPTGGGAAIIRQLGASARSFTLSSIQGPRTYSMSVSARNAVGAGPASSPAARTVTSRPAAPVGASATAGDQQATVSWSAPASDGGEAIVAYWITAYAGGVARSAITVGGDARSHTFTGLANGTTYTFRIQAQNDWDLGPESAPTDAVTPVAGATVPSAPTGVTATAGFQKLSVRWDPPSDDGGAEVTGYRLVLLEGFATEAVIDLSPSTRSHTFGLPPGSSYRGYIYASNAAGGGQLASFDPVAVHHWSPLASAQIFVDQQYRDLAGRLPTSTERSQAITQLTSSRFGATDLIESLARRSYWDGTLSPIIRLYLAIYLRDPDTGGLQYWESQIRSGRTTINRMADVVARNQEFRTLYGTLSDSQFVEKVYDLVLGRAPSTADRAYWVGELTRGQPRGKMVLLFSGSSEYKARSRARVTAIILEYGLLRIVRTTDIDALLPLVGTGGVFGPAITRLLQDDRYLGRLK